MEQNNIIMHRANREIFARAATIRQQYLIDEVKISFEEFKKRLDNFDFVNKVNELLPNLKDGTREKTLLAEVLDIYNGGTPPVIDPALLIPAEQSE